LSIEGSNLVTELRAGKILKSYVPDILTVECSFLVLSA